MQDVAHYPHKDQSTNIREQFLEGPGTATLQDLMETP